VAFTKPCRFSIVWDRDTRTFEGMAVQDIGFPTLTEKRLYARVRHEVEVRCRPAAAPAPALRGRASDVSRGGLRLSLPVAFRAGQVLDVAIRDESFDLNLGLRGTIVWVEPLADGGWEVGIQFCDLSPEQQENLLAFVGAVGGVAARERRRFVRLERSLGADIWRAGLLPFPRTAATVMDISLDGMAAVAEREFAQGALCAVELRLLEPARLKGRVLESSPRPDAGKWVLRMRFERFEKDARQRIGRFLSHEIELSILTRVRAL
jgi:c-di-GMP-binding flagellar brake protein YcgR